MNRFRKAVALFLAAVMCIPAVPASAAAKKSKAKEAADEVKFNTGSYEYRMTQKKDMEDRLKDFSDKYGVSAMEPERYQGNKEAEAEAADLRHYAVYEPDGDYEIVVEENAFFPYEVQFSYDGQTFCEWFMENGDSVTVGGHKFHIKSAADGQVVTKMSVKAGGDIIRVYPEEKVFTNDDNSLFQGASLLPLKEKKLCVNLDNYTPVEQTRITFAEIFQGEKEMPEGISVMWKKQTGNTMISDYKVGTLHDFFDLYGCGLEIIVGRPDQLAADNIRYLIQPVSEPSSSSWLRSSVCTGDDARKEIESTCWYRTSGQSDGSEKKVAEIEFKGPKKDGQYFLTLGLNPDCFDFDKLGFSEMKVFEGECTQDSLGKEITHSIWGDGMDNPGSGYLITLKDNEADQWITFVSYKNGRITGCLPIELQITDEFYSGVKNRNLVKETENGDVSVSNSCTIRKKDEVTEYTYKLTDDPVNGQYKLTFDYYRKDDGEIDNASNEFQAYKGLHDSVKAAQDAGAEDVRATLFGDGYRADYSGEGVTFSIFIVADDAKDQVRRIYRIKTETEGQDPEPGPQPGGSLVSLGGLKAQDGAEISYVSEWITQSDGTMLCLYRLRNPYSLEEPYTLRFYYKKDGKPEKPGNDVMAYQGRYGSIQEAQAAGEANIRDTLFENGYTTDFSSGISFSIFIGPDGDAGQIKYNYRVQTDRYLDSSTWASFIDVKTKDGVRVPYYMLRPQVHDSFDGNNYTIFAGDKTIEPEQPVDLSALVLEYQIPKGAKMFVNGNQEGDHQSSPIDFSSKNVQFTVASEDGQHQENYFIRIFKSGTAGEASHPAELYVTSLDHDNSETKRGEITESKRELFLDSKHNNLHDILIANVGYTSMPALQAELKSDSIVMDDYWKLNGTYDLAGFTTAEQSQDNKNGTLPNLAKVRLKAKDGQLEARDYGDLGTLTLTAKEPSGQKTKMVLHLTGVVGDPRMTMAKIKSPTKYVPYGILITNNNTYDWNNPEYELIKGRLPEGMTLMPNGELYGVPMESGQFEITIRMDNADPLQPDTRTYQFEVLDNSDDNVANAEDEGYELEKKIKGIDDTTKEGNYLIISKGVFDEYTDLYIDGKKLKQGDDYQAESGSTRITIISKALPKSEGAHTIGVEFRKNKKQRVVKAAAQNYNVKKKETVNRPVYADGPVVTPAHFPKTDPEPGPKPNPDPEPNPAPVPNTQPNPEPDPDPEPNPVRKDLANAASYTVRAGDTLKSIAKQFYGRSGKWKKIFDANKELIPASKKLKKGMKLKIPALNYTVKKGDDIKSIAKKYFGARSKWKIIYKVNRDVVPASLKVKAGTRLVLPVPVVCTVYTVRKGDNLGKIAQKYYGSESKWKKIFQANPDKIYRSYRMKIGSQLHIPAMTCTAKKKDDLKSLAKKYYGSEKKWRQIYDANKDVIPKSKKIKTGVTLVIPVPVDIS